MLLFLTERNGYLPFVLSVYAAEEKLSLAGREGKKERREEEEGKAWEGWRKRKGGRRGRVDRREDLSILPLEIFLGLSHHLTRFSLLSDGACDLNPLNFFFS